MQFDREVTDALTIRSFEPGRIRVGETWHDGHLIISRDSIITPWQVDEPSDITTAALMQALRLEPEILLIGTGSSYVMCDVELIGELATRGIGTEIMDTAAACRTFNVLVHEHRAVVAALYNA
ncbi:MAG: MTH938/NDUFAF3 family protein [Gammaproteobacteria bacterium]